jgi:hypothetical protein
MSADRNLLFGVLALQMDFVSRETLIAAMNAWVLDKHKPLGPILHEQPARGRRPRRGNGATCWPTRTQRSGRWRGCGARVLPPRSTPCRLARGLLSSAP